VAFFLGVVIVALGVLAGLIYKSGEDISKGLD